MHAKHDGQSIDKYKAIKLPYQETAFFIPAMIPRWLNVRESEPQGTSEPIK